jgi:hypothetical protein
MQAASELLVFTIPTDTGTALPVVHMPLSELKNQSSLYACNHKAFEPS